MGSSPPTGSRVCQNCKNKIEGSGTKFCSLSCSAKAQAAAQWAGYDPQRECVECGDLFSCRRKGRQRFCSRSCSASFNNRKKVTSARRATKECPGCLNEFLARQSKNVFCSSTCVQVKKRRERIEAWLSGEVVVVVDHLPNYIREYVRSLRGAACWQCGWEEVHPVTGAVPTEVDHVDGNPCNNLPDNLRLLCPNCHSLTPSYRALNKGNGRESRRIPCE